MLPSDLNQLRIRLAGETLITAIIGSSKQEISRCKRKQNPEHIRPE
jgi:hypothetical protein